MHDYTPKQLYMANGGNTRYIYSDGFGDNYKATREEEQAWRNELVENTLAEVNIATNASRLRMHIENLHFHNVTNLEAILIAKLNDTNVNVCIAIATGLWKYYKFEESFNVIHACFTSSRRECLHEVFTALNDFHNNIQAKEFSIHCLQQGDEELNKKATTLLGMWSYMGLSMLRDTNVLDQLKTDDPEMFRQAIHNLTAILGVVTS